MLFQEVNSTTHKSSFQSNNFIILRLKYKILFKPTQSVVPAEVITEYKEVDRASIFPTTS